MVTLTNRVCTIYIIIYGTLVRPHLEYVAPILDPYLVKDVENIKQ